METLEIVSTGGRPEVARDVLVRVSRPAQRADEETGSDEITCPSRFTAAEALAFVDRTMFMTDEAATVVLLRMCLGHEGYALLLTTPEIGDTQLGQIIAECRNRVMGPLEAPKG